MAVRYLAVLFPVVLGIALVACSDDGATPDGGTDGGTDGAPDADSDTDTDGDSDTDTDGDSDADAGEDGGTSHEVVDVSAGVSHTCAVIEDGNVKCWGSQQFGALGYGNDLDAFPDADTSRPSTLPFVNVGVPVARIEASYYFTCALFGSDGVLCWGFNSAGQLGQAVGYSTGVVDVPADYDPIVLDGPVTQISTGGGHACALLESGVLECWGNNDEGQAVDRGGSFQSVSAGGFHTCWIWESGRVGCMGDNANGQCDHP